MLRAKAAVIDRVVSAVGRSNIACRSFVHQAEIDAIAVGDNFGRQMQSFFNRYRRASAQVYRGLRSKRGVRPRLMECWSD